MTFNLQTNTLFIDLRIPHSKTRLFGPDSRHTIKSLDDLTGRQLKWYARQHIFAGLTRRNKEERLNCTRFHCIDWNFVGTPRSRPNRWYVELCNEKLWKEWAYACDDHKQHYYCEYWQRLDDIKTDRPVIALQTADHQALIVVVGDHFNYVVNRHRSELAKEQGSLVEEVDRLVEANDLENARKWLSIQGGHGRITTDNDWKLDHCIELWKENTPLWRAETVHLTASGTLVWNDLEFEISESNIIVDEFRQLLPQPQPPAAKKARVGEATEG